MKALVILILGILVHTFYKYCPRATARNLYLIKSFTEKKVISEVRGSMLKKIFWGLIKLLK